MARLSDHPTMTMSEMPANLTTSKQAIVQIRVIRTATASLERLHPLYAIYTVMWKLPSAQQPDIEILALLVDEQGGANNAHNERRTWSLRRLGLRKMNWESLGRFCGLVSRDMRLVNCSHGGL